MWTRGEQEGAAFNGLALTAELQSRSGAYGHAQCGLVTHSVALVTHRVSWSCTVCPWSCTACPGHAQCVLVTHSVALLLADLRGELRGVGCKQPALNWFRKKPVVIQGGRTRTRQ